MARIGIIGVNDISSALPSMIERAAREKNLPDDVILRAMAEGGERPGVEVTSALSAIIATKLLTTVRIKGAADLVYPLAAVIKRRMETGQFGGDAEVSFPTLVVMKERAYGGKDPLERFFGHLAAGDFALHAASGFGSATMFHDDGYRRYAGEMALGSYDNALALSGVVNSSFTRAAQLQIPVVIGRFDDATAIMSAVRKDIERVPVGMDYKAKDGKHKNGKVVYDL